MNLWLPVLKTRKYKAGFTLIEAIIVMTLFAIIGTGLAASLSSGLKIWSRAKNAGIASSEVMLITDLIARDLRQSTYLPQPGFEGKPDRVSFLSFSGDSVCRFIYIFDPAEKKLSRRQEGFESVLEEDIEGKYTEKKVADLDGLEFSYLYYDKDKDEYSWKDEWPKDDGKATAVKIKAKIGNQEYEKTVFIPAAA